MPSLAPEEAALLIIFFAWPYSWQDPYKSQEERIFSKYCNKHPKVLGPPGSDRRQLQSHHNNWLTEKCVPQKWKTLSNYPAAMRKDGRISENLIKRAATVLSKRQGQNNDDGDDDDVSLSSAASSSSSSSAWSVIIPNRRRSSPAKQRRSKGKTRNPPSLIVEDKNNPNIGMKVPEHILVDRWWDPSAYKQLRKDCAAFDMPHHVAVLERPSDGSLKWVDAIEDLPGKEMMIIDTLTWRWTPEEWDIRFPGPKVYFKIRFDMTEEEWAAKRETFRKNILNKIKKKADREDGKFRIDYAPRAKFQDKVHKFLRYLIHAKLPVREEFYQGMCLPYDSTKHPLANYLRIPLLVRADTVSSQPPSEPNNKVEQRPKRNRRSPRVVVGNNEIDEQQQQQQRQQVEEVEEAEDNEDETPAAAVSAILKRARSELKSVEEKFGENNTNRNRNGNTEDGYLDDDHDSDDSPFAGHPYDSDSLDNDDEEYLEDDDTAAAISPASVSPRRKKNIKRAILRKRKSDGARANANQHEDSGCTTSNRGDGDSVGSDEAFDIIVPSPEEQRQAALCYAMFARVGTGGDDPLPLQDQQEIVAMQGGNSTAAAVVQTEDSSTNRSNEETGGNDGRRGGNEETNLNSAEIINTTTDGTGVATIEPDEEDEESKTARLKKATACRMSSITPFTETIAQTSTSMTTQITAVISQIEEEKDSLKTELRNAKKELIKEKAELHEMRNQLEAGNQAVAKLVTDLDEKERNLKTTTEELTAKTSEATLVGTQYEATKNELNEKERDMGALRTKLDVQDQELKKLVSELDSTKKKLNTKTDAVASFDTKLDAIKEELNVSKSEADKLRTQFNETTDELKAKKSEFDSEKNKNKVWKNMAQEKGQLQRNAEIELDRALFNLQEANDDNRTASNKMEKDSTFRDWLKTEIDNSSGVNINYLILSKLEKFD